MARDVDVIRSGQHAHIRPRQCARRRRGYHSLSSPNSLRYDPTKRSSSLYSVIVPGGRGSLIAIGPSVMGSLTGSSPAPSIIRRSYPGIGSPQEPAWFPQRQAGTRIGHPLSVCHQLSTMSTPSIPEKTHSVWVGTLPARNIVDRDVRSWDDACCGWGLRRIARSAVGAVNIALTPAPSTTFQNAEASGVPTGFPSYKTVVQPEMRGPYTMYECPTTQPMSEAAQGISPEVRR